MAFEARILGPVEATVDGRKVVLGSPKQRAVFALLVLNAGRVVSTDRMTDELWGDQTPESPSSSLQVYISRLRRSLRADTEDVQDSQDTQDSGADEATAAPSVQLLRRGAGYQLDVPESSIDAHRFADLVSSARSLLPHRPPDARLLIEEALSLLRGPTLADVVGSLGTTGTAEVKRLDDLRLIAQESRLQALLAEGDHARAAADAAALVREHPWQESLRATLMLSLYRAGRQAEALQAYDDVREELAEQLGVDPGTALRELHASILRQDPGLDPVTPPPVPAEASADERLPRSPIGSVATGKVPEPLTTLVGRDSEVEEVLDAVSRARLVALVGTGGAGKTRVATAVATTYRDRLPGGVWWVDVSALDDPATLPLVVGVAVGGHEPPEGTPLESAISHVGDQRALLVLDNCEHLAAACAEVIEQVLAGCPGLRVLATSREPLSVPGELVWPVLPLALPPSAGSASEAEIASSPAVRLWSERASAALRGFRLDQSNSAVVARICHRLDGLPLAIELATARLRVLSLEEIADALDHHLEVLVAPDRGLPERHRTLRATLDWSFRLLEADEQRLLARLSVFHGGFTLDAAAAVHDAGPGARSALDVVSGLIDRSLVVVVDRGRPTRYRLLETIRLFAAEQLDAQEGARTASDRHLGYFLEVAEAAERQLLGPSQQDWLDRLDGDVANLVGALRWSVGAGAAPEAGLRLVSALWRFWYLRGHYLAGREWLDATLAAAPHAPAAVRADALASAGRFAYLQCDYGAAEDRLHAALSSYGSLDDDIGTAAVLQSLGCVARERGDYAASLALHRDSRQRWQAAGRPDEVARSSNYLAFVAWLAGDRAEALAESVRAREFFATAEDGEGSTWSLLIQGALACYSDDLAQAAALLDESRRQAEAVSYQEGVAWSLNLLGVTAVRSGDPHTARTLLADSLRVHWELGDRWRTASVLEGLADAEGRLGDALWAGHLLGAAEALRSRIAAPVPAVERADAEAVAARLFEQVDSGRLASALAEGRRSPLERTVLHAVARVG
ncbi:AfsR/SARP family transcriptional regulator [Nocardioides sp. URHA0020]|uniref:AfsR/SARP family transcriptional regulator n=1 Tax=Nocardioides sp. URHA0020 TaxID=1380392 RepID=UPI00068892E6|nr:BTAD domain-containing putative transcriptional regulator [Nocardioides sp. URHA0020]